ncbi:MULTISPECIES: TniQ family protein [Pseudomonas]|uniref:TniQ family protein n=1 Tax=Pseudomonas TaxID=286 RepID=UPI0011B0555F|nr:TniQ family protein [Pseudomonas sp. MYb187]
MKIFSPLPGEYVASALQRGNEMLGIKTLSPADFRIIPIPRKGYARTGLGQKSEYRKHAVFQFPSLFTERKITEEILQNHTLYPLTAALGRSTTNTIVTPTTWKKICPDCAYEDFENLGTAYVHRSHVQASVQVCSIHGSNLITTCPACSTPIQNHDITSLGVCSQKYKNSIRQLNSPNHSYSIFIAELLNYKGAPVKRDDAQWIVGKSLYIKYFNEMCSDENYSSKIITREFGAKSINSNYRTASDQSFTIQAFLGCGTAERYLDLLTNKAATAQLQKEVNALDHARRRRKTLTA